MLPGVSGLVNQLVRSETLIIFGLISKLEGIKSNKVDWLLLISWHLEKSLTKAPYVLQSLSVYVEG